MKVVLRNPRREVEVRGGRRVKDVLAELDIIPETVLVIRGDALMTADQVVGEHDTIELRPVMSGGSASRGAAGGAAPRGEPGMDRVVRAEGRPAAPRREASGEMIRDRDA